MDNPPLPQCCPVAGPNIPAWDNVARFLTRQQEVVTAMQAFWSSLDIGRRQWLCEVRGLFARTLTFTYLRTGRYAEANDLQLLVNEIESKLSVHYWDYTFTKGSRIDLWARSTDGFAVCIWTPYASAEALTKHTSIRLNFVVEDAVNANVSTES